MKIDTKIRVIMVSKSAKYYQTHQAAMARKSVYEKRFESSPSQKAKSR